MKSRARAAKVAAGKAVRSRNSRPFRSLIRTGFAVNGIIHVVIGAIAVQVATGGASGSADHSGALGQLAAAPGGAIVLWVVTVGLAALGASSMLEVFVVPKEDKSARVAAIAKHLGKGVVYLALAGTALTFARGGSTNSEQSSKQASADLLSLPGGAVIATLVGVGVVAVAVYFVVKGVRQSFTDDIVLPTGSIGTATRILGIVGYSAKGISLGAVGILFTVAAFTVDPNKAAGIDGALKTLVGLPFGMAILIAIGAGLVAYGIYSCLRARFARV